MYIRRMELEDEDWMMGTRDDRKHWRNTALEIIARVYRDGHQEDGVKRRGLDDGDPGQKTVEDDHTWDHGESVSRCTSVGRS